MIKQAKHDGVYIKDRPAMNGRDLATLDKGDKANVEEFGKVWYKVILTPKIIGYARKVDFTNYKEKSNERIRKTIK